MPTIKVSADRVKDGVVKASTYGEIVVAVDGDRVTLVADANWKCDRFSMQVVDAASLIRALSEASLEAFRNGLRADRAMEVAGNGQ